MTWWMDLLVAGAFAIAFLVLFEWAKHTASRPQREQVMKLAEEVMARLASEHGYTLHLVLDNGEPIGTEEGGRFSPSSYVSGGSFMYGSTKYEIVDVRDEYPKAVGTLVLKASDSP